MTDCGTTRAFMALSFGVTLYYVAYRVHRRPQRWPGHGGGGCRQSEVIFRPSRAHKGSDIIAPHFFFSFSACDSHNHTFQVRPAHRPAFFCASSMNGEEVVKLAPLWEGKGDHVPPLRWQLPPLDAASICGDGCMERCESSRASTRSCLPLAIA